MRHQVPLESDEWLRSPARKDTKRWCKGHVGREHQLACVFARHPYGWDSCGSAPAWAVRIFHTPWRCYHETICQVCGKRMKKTPWRECPDLPQWLRERVAAEQKV